VEEFPEQTAIGLALPAEGETEFVLILTITLAHDVVLHRLSALTKYVFEIVGLIIIEAPVPEKEPPQLPEYQFQIAPAPNVPPEIFNVAALPGHNDEGIVIADVAEVDVVFTTIVLLKHIVELHNPSALSQYVVVTDGLITTNTPVPANVPAHEVMYQCHSALVPNIPPVSASVTVLPGQISEEEAVNDEAIVDG
jgi:hypothetical protein